MNEGRQQCWKWANRAAGGALSMALAAAAVASPPPGRGSTMPANPHSGDTGGGRLSALPLQAAAHSSLAAKLDLRAPAEVAAGSAPTGGLQVLAVDGLAFPSVRHTSDDAARGRPEEQLPSFGTEGLVAHPMSRAQQLATRFRREGLPVARLFESHSALVSLGLNQRGKPGIWLIQKLP
jgi:hypothetical protein